MPSENPSALPKSLLASTELFNPKDLSKNNVTEEGGQVMDSEGTLVCIPALENRLFQVPLRLIIPNPQQPREYFDEKKLDELEQSIQQEGQCHPIVCVPCLLKNGEIKLFIIDGERRYRVLKTLNFTRGKVEIVWVASERELFTRSLILNESRADHNPIERAKAYKKMIDFEMDAEEINKTAALVKVAEILGISGITIYNHLRLLEMPEEIQKLIIEGKLPVTNALYLAQAKNQFGENLNMAKVARKLIDNPEEESDTPTKPTLNGKITRTNIRKTLKEVLMSQGDKKAAMEITASVPLFEMQAATNTLLRAINKVLDMPPNQAIKYLKQKATSPAILKGKLETARKLIDQVLRNVVEPTIHSAAKVPVSPQKVTRQSPPPPPPPPRTPAPTPPRTRLPASPKPPNKTPKKRETPSAPATPKKFAPFIDDRQIFVVKREYRSQYPGVAMDKFTVLPEKDERYEALAQKYEVGRKDVLLIDPKGRIIRLPKHAIISLKELEKNITIPFVGSRKQRKNSR